MSASHFPARCGRAKVIAGRERGLPARLTHGELYGRFQHEVDAGGFSLALVRADPCRDVQRHTHDAAHFVFVTHGTYLTTAAGAPGVCASPILLYNPPGTTHRDRFAGREGCSRRFVGCSPGAFLRRERVQRAAALRRSESEGLSTIALASGFADQSHMTRAFRRLLGITP